MVVYIEYVIIDNLVIDILILLTVAKIAKLKTTKLKLFSSSLIGTAIAVLSPVLPGFVNLAIKPFVAVLMVVVAFKPSSFKTLALYVVLLFFATFLYGGTLIGLMEMFSIQFTISNGISYANSFPVGVAILFCLLGYMLLKNIIVFCTRRQQKSKFLYDICLQNAGIKLKITAFLDSGNCVCVNGKPLTIINYKTFNLLYPNIAPSEILLKKNLPLKNQAYTKIAGIANMSENILTFEIDAIQIQNKTTKEALIGLSLKNFEDKTNSDAIISNLILESDL